MSCKPNNLLFGLCYYTLSNQIVWALTPLCTYPPNCASFAIHPCVITYQPLPEPKAALWNGARASTAKLHTLELEKEPLSTEIGNCQAAHIGAWKGTVVYEIVRDYQWDRKWQLMRQEMTINWQSEKVNEELKTRTTNWVGQSIRLDRTTNWAGTAWIVSQRLSMRQKMTIDLSQDSQRISLKTKDNQLSWDSQWDRTTIELGHASLSFLCQCSIVFL